MRWVSATKCLAECGTLRSVWDGSALPNAWLNVAHWGVCEMGRHYQMDVAHWGVCEMGRHYQMPGWMWHIEECVRWVSTTRCLAECGTLRSVRGHSDTNACALWWGKVMTKEVLLSVIVKAEQSLCGISRPWPPCRRFFVSGWCHRVTQGGVIVSLRGRDGLLFTLYLIVSTVMVSWYPIV